MRIDSVHCRESTGTGPVVVLYADDAGVISQSPERLRKVIVIVCVAFGLTVSEAKTEIMCLRTKGMLESAAAFSVEAAG